MRNVLIVIGCLCVLWILGPTLLSALWFLLGVLLLVACLVFIAGTVCYLIGLFLRH